MKTEPKRFSMWDTGEIGSWLSHFKIPLLFQMLFTQQNVKFILHQQRDSKFGIGCLINVFIARKETLWKKSKL